MTGTTPTAGETVDLYTWSRDFHGIRPRGTEDERPVKLNSAARNVANAIAAHINGKSGTATLGIRRIAESAQVSTSTARAAVEAIEAAGWLEVTRSTRTGTKSNATSTYRLTSPIAATRQRPTSDDAEVYRESLHPVAGIATPCSGNRYETKSLTTSSTTSDEKISPNAAASARDAAAIDQKRRDGDETAELYSLHDEWTPNNAHRSVAADLGLDLDLEAAAFRKAVTANRTRSRKWGAVFTEYLRRSAEGTVADMFRWGLDAEDARSEKIAEAAVATITAAASQPLSATQTNETAPPVPEAPGTAHEAPTVDLEAVAAEPGDNGRYWTHHTEPVEVEAVDAEAERAAVVAMFDAAISPAPAEIAAQRRGQITRKIAAALPGGIRARERAEILDRIDAGETAAQITAAILEARTEAKRRAAAELASIAA